MRGPCLKTRGEGFRRSKGFVKETEKKRREQTIGVPNIPTEFRLRRRACKQVGRTDVVVAPKEREKAVREYFRKHDGVEAWGKKVTRQPRCRIGIPWKKEGAAINRRRGWGVPKP